MFKAQTVIAETILEYYGDYEAPNVAHLARINIDVFNILLPEIVRNSNSSETSLTRENVYCLDVVDS